MASRLPLGHHVESATLVSKSVQIAEVGKQITVDVVVDSSGGTRAPALNGNVGLSPGKNIVHRREGQLALNKQSSAGIVAARVDGIVISGIPGGRTPGKAGGTCRKPQSVDR